MKYSRLTSRITRGVNIPTICLPIFDNSRRIKRFSWTKWARYFNSNLSKSRVSFSLFYKFSSFVFLIKKKKSSRDLSNLEKARQSKSISRRMTWYVYNRPINMFSFFKQSFVSIYTEKKDILVLKIYLKYYLFK